MSAPVVGEDLGHPPQDVLDAWDRDCRCCGECSDRPCGAVQQGGVCETICRCDEDRGEDDDFDPNACPGCGGNCARACR